VAITRGALRCPLCCGITRELGRPDKQKLRMRGLGWLPQKPRQLGDIRSNPSRLIFAEQLGRRAPPRLTLIINVAQRLTVGVTDNEAVRRDFDSPRRREAAGRLSRIMRA
jgi:hypothetical protein